MDFLPKRVASLEICFWMMRGHFCDEFSFLQLVDFLSEGRVLPSPHNNLVRLLPILTSQSHSHPADSHLLRKESPSIV